MENFKKIWRLSFDTLESGTISSYYISEEMATKEMEYFQKDSATYNFQLKEVYVKLLSE